MSADVSLMPVTAATGGVGNAMQPNTTESNGAGGFSAAFLQALTAVQTPASANVDDTSTLFGQLPQQDMPLGAEKNLMPTGNRLPPSMLSANVATGKSRMAVLQDSVADEMAALAGEQASEMFPGMQWQGMVAYNDSNLPGTSYYLIQGDDRGEHTADDPSATNMSWQLALGAPLLSPQDTSKLTEIPIQFVSIPTERKDVSHLHDLQSPIDDTGMAPWPAFRMEKSAGAQDSLNLSQAENAQFVLALHGQTDNSDTPLASTGMNSAISHLPASVNLLYTQQSNNFSQAQLPPMGVTPDQPGWGDALGNRVQWLVNNQIQQADIRLDPPDLGSLDVRVRLNGHEQAATITFSSPHAQVRDAVEHAIPRLREMFADAGLTLGDVNVSHQSMGDHQRSSQQMAGDSGHGGSRQGYSSREQANEVTASEGIRTMVRHGNGLLDTYA